MSADPADPLTEAFRAACGGERINDIAEAALLMGALDRRGADLGPYRAHLADLARAARKHREVHESHVRAQIVADIMTREFGYEGDPELFDVPENSNLLGVIDRRAGVPVTLGILYLHVARAAGWRADGASFPGQLLVRIEGDNGMTLVDPFDEGRIMKQADIFSLMHGAPGRMARFDESYLEPVPDDAVLIRVLNNLKALAIQQQDLTRALELLDRMLVIAPLEAAFLYEQAQLLAQEGRPMAAKRKFEAVIDLDPEGAFAERSFEDLAGIKHQLN